MPRSVRPNRYTVIGTRAFLILMGTVLRCLGADESSAAEKLDRWRDYQIIMWQPQTTAGYASLKSIGFTGAALIANWAEPKTLPGAAEPLLQSDMPWYVENIATDFYSSYHRWSPDRPMNWRFTAIQELYRKNPDNSAAFIRDPSLSDPAWLEKVRNRLTQNVITHRPYQPLFYNLADEPGIADLNAFWDFDFSPISLAAMRTWLKSKYGSLAALNAEWNTQFSRWEEVTPQTTAAAMRRTDQNFAAWADGKEWMDVAFADALAAGRDAVHVADPNALAGLEGGQQPGWGGYNYMTLVGAVDVMETEPRLAHSLNPHLRLVTTSFGDHLADIHRIWRALLDGSGAIIIWDAKHQVVDVNGTIGNRGRRLAEYFSELRSGIGALLLKSEESPSNVAILYSPASFRVQWLLDWKDKGDAWLGRNAGAEDRDNGTVRATMYEYERSLEQVGFMPRFLSSDMIENGALTEPSIHLLVLPHAIALSAAEAKAIEVFAARGGVVVADVIPGVFDEHGRNLDHPRLMELFRSGHALLFLPGRLREVADADPPTQVGADDVDRFRILLAQFGVLPEVVVRNRDGTAPVDLAIHSFRNGEVTLIALQRDLPSDNGGDVTLRLTNPAHIYDVRSGSYLGNQRVLRLALDKAVPTILALSPRCLPRPSLAIHRLAQFNGVVSIGLSLPEGSLRTANVIHVAVFDPSGRAVQGGSGNFLVRPGESSIHLRLGEVTVGKWTVEATDVMSGQRATEVFGVSALK